MQALAKSTIVEDITIYRGSYIHLDPSQGNGTEITYYEYASVGYDIAHTFHHPGLILKIRVLRETVGSADVRAISQHKNEGDFLMARQMRFEIIELNKVGHRLIATVDIIP